MDFESSLGKNRKRLLFTCENLQELEALSPIAEEVEKLSGGQVQCEFASQDAFYCQGVDDALQEAGVKVCSLPYPIRLSKPFAFNSLSRKLLALLATNRQIAPVMQRYDGLVCGVDSAPARMLIVSAHRLGKPAFQVLISLYLGRGSIQRSLKDRYLISIKHLVKTCLARVTGADFLALPNRVTGSGCERVFVMGERVRGALVRDGVPEERIWVYGVPRFARLFELGEAYKLPHHPLGSINILYIPGAFASHGASAQHSLQQRQIWEIVECLSREGSGRYRLIVKMHPRERKEHYTWLTRYKGLVQVLSSDADLYEAILDSYVVVTIGSTASYESLLLKRPVVIARFPDQELLSIESLIGDFQVANSVQELMGIINNIRNNKNEYAELVKNEGQSVQEVIDPKTPESASLIARQMCTDMEVAYV